MEKFDLKKIAAMFESGSVLLSSQFEYINDLNVFPVPDGDTGTNMKITITGALAETHVEDYETIDKYGQAFSKGLLMNARGNSGVIFSQIMKGFTSVFPAKATEITISDVIKALEQAKIIAYKSVSKAVEGTILTIIRVVSEEVAKKATFKTMEELFKYILKIAEETLAKTPDMLPPLKEVGVVDSGGYGLCRFFEGMYNCLINNAFTTTNVKTKSAKKSTALEPHTNEEGFGYCSEIILELNAKIKPDSGEKIPFDLKKYRKELEAIGDSLVLVQDDNIVKVHIHTFEPYKLLKISQKYGEFIKTKFDNMTNQFFANMKRQGIDLQKKELDTTPTIIMTVPSDKIGKYYRKNYDIKYFINTDDKGNPSINEFLSKIMETNSSKVYIITDDSNIVLAANQVIALAKKDKIDVVVIPGKNTIEALFSAISYTPNIDFIRNKKIMSNSLKETVSGMVSTCVKDVDYKHIKVRVGNYIGIMDKSIVEADYSEEKVVIGLAEKLLKKYGKEADIVMIIYGKDAKISVIRKVEKYLAEHYGVYCEVISGGQKTYSYYIGIQ